MRRKTMDKIAARVSKEVRQAMREQTQQVKERAAEYAMPAPRHFGRSVRMTLLDEYAGRTAGPELPPEASMRRYFAPFNNDEALNHELRALLAKKRERAARAELAAERQRRVFAEQRASELYADLCAEQDKRVPEFHADNPAGDALCKSVEELATKLASSQAYARQLEGKIAALQDHARLLEGKIRRQREAIKASEARRLQLKDTANAFGKIPDIPGAPQRIGASLVEGVVAGLPAGHPDRLRVRAYVDYSTPGRTVIGTYLDGRG